MLQVYINPQLHFFGNLLQKSGESLLKPVTEFFDWSW